jgi:hypothetical protein
MTRASGSQSGPVSVSIIYPGQIDIVSTACVGPMTDKVIELDEHRGMAAQKATDLRRLLADVEANETALRLRQDELEAHLIAAPAANWGEPPGRRAISQPFCCYAVRARPAQANTHLGRSR